MMNLQRVEIDGRRRKVTFHGNCFEMHEVCQAMCCCEWEVDISSDEYASGLYSAESICSFTKKACSNGSLPCINRGYLLSKKEDKSCIYLEGNQCSIYVDRPRTCRDFQCSGGWRLGSVFSAHNSSPPDKTALISAKESFLEHLTGDRVFVLHPLVRLHTLFYLKERGEIIFVKEMVGSCGKFNTCDQFDIPAMDDSLLMRLVGMFNLKLPLEEIYRRYCSQSESVLPLKEFYLMVWLLNKHSILIDSRYFRGMLSGMGGV